MVAVVGIGLDRKAAGTAAVEDERYRPRRVATWHCGAIEAKSVAACTGTAGDRDGDRHGRTANDPPESHRPPRCVTASRGRARAPEASGSRSKAAASATRGCATLVAVPPRNPAIETIDTEHDRRPPAPSRPPTTGNVGTPACEAGVDADPGVVADGASGCAASAGRKRLGFDPRTHGQGEAPAAARYQSPPFATGGQRRRARTEGAPRRSIAAHHEEVCSTAAATTSDAAPTSVVHPTPDPGSSWT